MSTYSKNAQLVITYTVPGLGTLTKSIHNVLNYSSYLDTGSPVGINTLTFLTAWKTQVAAALRACLDFSTKVAVYTAYDLGRPTVSPTVQYPALAGTYNMTPGAPAPALVCAFAYLKTINRGRGSWGGVHLGGLPLAGIEGNIFGAGFQGYLDTLMTAMVGPFTDGDGIAWKQCILSRTKSSLVPPGPPVNVVANAVYLSDSAWDDQVKKLTRRSVGLIRA